MNVYSISTAMEKARLCLADAYSLVVMVVLIITDISPITATTREMHFYKNSNSGSPAATPTSSLSSAHSTFQCGLRCLGAASTCTTFLHNSTTGSCVTGAMPADPESNWNEGQGDMYVTCDLASGFDLFQHGSEVACIQKGTGLNYTNSLQACEDQGAVLASVRNLDKLNLLTYAMGPDQFWVGMDVLQNATEYIWRDGGDLAFSSLDYPDAQRDDLAAAAMPDMWNFKEPNFFEQVESCIQLKWSTTYNETRLNDYRCPKRMNYACEKKAKFE